MKTIESRSQLIENMKESYTTRLAKVNQVMRILSIKSQQELAERLHYSDRKSIHEYIKSSVASKRIGLILDLIIENDKLSNTRGVLSKVIKELDKAEKELNETNI